MYTPLYSDTIVYERQITHKLNVLIPEHPRLHLFVSRAHERVKC